MKRDILTIWTAAMAVLLPMTVSGRTIYVDERQPPGGNGGSWQTAFTYLQDALYEAQPGDEIWLAEGRYTPDMDVRGLVAPGDQFATFELRSGVKILGGFPPDGTGNAQNRAPDIYVTVLSGDINVPDDEFDNSYHVISCFQTGPGTVLDGVRIRAGNAAAPGSNDTRGGGLLVEGGELVLIDCGIETNHANIGGGIYNGSGARTHLIHSRFVKCSAETAGGTLLNTADAELTLTDCSLIGSRFYEADDLVNVGQGSIVALYGVTELEAIKVAGSRPYWLNAESIVICRNVTVKGILVGEGYIEIPTRLSLTENAQVNLGQGPNPAGEVFCYGLLNMADQALLIAGRVRVQNDYGQFFLRDGSMMMVDHFIAEGDELPDYVPFVGNPEQINIGRLDVILYENEDSFSGELLEARGVRPANPDIVCDPVIINFCEYMQPVPPFSMTDWTIDRLVVRENARVSMTNRFAYQTPDEQDEVVYVRELVLEPGSVLNLSGHSLYYNELNRADSARVINLPLMGFSLDDLRMDREADVAIRLNTNNPEDEAAYRVRQVFGVEPDPAGMLEMRTVTSPSGGVQPARITARFEKMNEDKTAIRFEYIFFGPEAEGKELAVYLTDTPGDAAARREIGVLRPPTADRAGAVGSDEFAIFSANVYRRDLNGIMGTYLVVELREAENSRKPAGGEHILVNRMANNGGSGSGVYMNNLDTQIQCYHHRYDFNASGLVGIDDYLLVVAEYGLVDPNLSLACLDVTEDYNVNIEDLLVWSEDMIASASAAAGNAGGRTWDAGREARQSKELLENAKLIEMSGQGGPDPNTPWTERSALLMSGNPTHSPSGWIGNKLYPVYIPGWEDPNSGQPPEIFNHRLLSDAAGEVYQIDGARGIARIADDVVVVEPNTVAYGDVTVEVDFEQVSDAAFDPFENDTVYVAPVWVTPQSGCEYQAAAQLEIGANGVFTLEQLFGMNPADDPEQNNSPGDCNDIVQFVYEPDVQHLHEVEVDWQGRLYVLSACGRGANNWLLTYDIETGTSSEQRFDLTSLAPGLSSAVEMAVSPTRRYVYVADMNGTADPCSPQMKLLGFPVSEVGDEIALGAVETFTIDTAEPAYCQSESCEEGYKAVLTGLVEDVRTGQLYAAGYTAPVLDLEELIFSATTDFFTTPVWASFDPAVSTQATAQVLEPTYDYPAALPLSLVWTARKACGAADLDDSLCINLGDINALAECWLKSGTGLVPSCTLSDIDGDGTVGLSDLSVPTEYWLECDCWNGGD